jgi:hypothetical protein
MGEKGNARNRNDEGLIEIHKQRLKTVHSRLCSINSSLRSPKPLPLETVWQAFWIYMQLLTLPRHQRSWRITLLQKISAFCPLLLSNSLNKIMYRVHSRNPKKKKGKKSTNITKSQLYRELRPLWKIVRAPILIQKLCRPPNSNISKLLENTITVMMKPVVQHHAFSLFWLTACVSQILPSPSVFLRIGILHAS